MDATTKALHPASVRNALRKAGETKAEFHRSGQVRGWGEWSRGYRVTANGTGVRVWYASPYRLGAERAEETDNALARYTTTLVAAGFAVCRIGDDLLVSRPSSEAA